MKNITIETQDLASIGHQYLDDILRAGAQRLLQMALEAEIEDFIERHKALKNDNGNQLVVRNGYQPERTIMTGVGNVTIKRPRIDDRRLEVLQKDRFESVILPKFVRRTPSINNLLPILYLQGVSSERFPEALQALLGEGAKNISSNTIMRLKDAWCREYEEWTNRDLSGKEYVYIWADGIYCNIRNKDEEKSCILVILGVTTQGDKELLAVSDGFRESKQSWREIFIQLQKQGLRIAPKLATCDGALGFIAAAQEFWPTMRLQRCWVHKTANVLDKLPTSVQPKAKSMLQNIYMAPSRKEAQKCFDAFVAAYSAKFPKAVSCLVKDREDLLAFYDFPAEHWIHIRTTNPIESTFATVRLRHRRTKGNCTRKTTITMIWKLAQEAEKGWRKLRGYNSLMLVQSGTKFVDGVKVDGSAA